MRRLLAPCLLLATVALPLASQTVVTPGNPQGWEIYTYNYGSPSSEPFGGYTSAFPRNGNGSAELYLPDEGLGEVQYWYGVSGSPLLSDLNQLSFDWYVSSSSTTPSFTTPALAFYVTSASQSGYLIWEGAYNGIYPNAPQDTWVTSNIIGDNFWYNGSDGSGACGNAAAYQSISWFESNCFSSDAYVEGFSPFLGFGYTGSEFHGAIDNLAYGFENGPAESFNFEATASTVPEPASMTLLATGLLGLAGVRRRRKA